MNGFQRTIMIIATVVLIICLIMIGIALRNHTKSVDYPPVVAQCPDYWEAQENENGSTLCRNVRLLGAKACKGSTSFDSWGLCKKSKWAKACDITWDGVTNNLSACKESE